MWYIAITRENTNINNMGGGEGGGRECMNIQIGWRGGIWPYICNVSKWRGGNEYNLGVSSYLCITLPHTCDKPH